MITDMQQISKIMGNTLNELYEDGEILPNADNNLMWEDHFPFETTEVLGVHTHKVGVGDGVWFRLSDGRVFNIYGEETESDQTALLPAE